MEPAMTLNECSSSSKHATYVVWHNGAEVTVRASSDECIHRAVREALGLTEAPVRIAYGGAPVEPHDTFASLGLEELGKITVTSMPLPDGTYRAQFQGNGNRPEGPYRAGGNYTATVTLFCDGSDTCRLAIDEESMMFGPDGTDYECCMTAIEDGKLKLCAVRERSWGLRAMHAHDESDECSWHESDGKCVLGVMHPDQGHVLLDLSAIHSFGPECRLDRVTTFVPHDPMWPHRVASKM